MDTEISQEGIEVGGDEAMEVFIHGAEGNPTLVNEVTVKSAGAPVVDDDRLLIHEGFDPVKVPVKRVAEAEDTEPAPAPEPAVNVTGLKSIEFEIHEGSAPARREEPEPIAAAPVQAADSVNTTGVRSMEFEIHDGTSKEETAASKGAAADEE